MDLARNGVQDIYGNRRDNAFVSLAFHFIYRKESHMVDVTKAVQAGYAMMIAAYHAIGKILPPYEQATMDDVGHYTEIVEFFIEHPDAPVEAFHEGQDGGEPYASLSMETRIMYTRLRRAALEAVQGQDTAETPRRADTCPDKECAHWDGHSGCSAYRAALKPLQRGKTARQSRDNVQGPSGRTARNSAQNGTQGPNSKAVRSGVQGPRSRAARNGVLGPKNGVEGLVPHKEAGRSTRGTR
jgi:hypothetical protein